MSSAALKHPDPPPRGRSVYAERKREKRLDARERIHGRVLHPITTPQLVRDPLVYKASPLRSTLTTTRVLLAAIFIHVVVLLAFLIFNRFLGGRSVVTPRSSVVVQIRDVPPPPPPEPEKKEPIEGPAPDDFAKEKVEPPPVEPAKADLKPQENVSADPTPEEPGEPEPLRRIIGLSFESTVEGGSGPSFATGTSRMGHTDERAVDPNQARKKPTRRSSGSTQESTGTREQRTASHIPTQTGVFVKPERKTPKKPPFPPTLRAQGIEGDVLVRVKIAASGAVTDVTVLQSSGHAAFDQAAREAALTEVFSPATRDGKPVPYTLTYSYRFRIED